MAPFAISILDDDLREVDIVHFVNDVDGFAGRNVESTALRIDVKISGNTTVLQAQAKGARFALFGFESVKGLA